MNKERHVLVIFPHPDDESFSSAGTLAHYIEMGVPVTYVCLTLGEMGRALGNPPFATRESLPEFRKEELQKAMEVIGLTDLRLYGYLDKTIEFIDDNVLTAQVSEVIAETNPSLVITFYPGYSVHPDHDATGRAVVRAIRKLPKEERPRLYCAAFSNGHEAELGEPDIVHNIEHVADKKIAALKAHASQTAWMLKDLEKKWKKRHPDAARWFERERYWTYKWEKDKVE